MSKEILLNEVVFKFEQSPDDCGPNEDQYLDVEIVDGGAGKYFVLKTERWAIDNIDELKTLFEKISKVIDQF